MSFSQASFVTIKEMERQNIAIYLLSILFLGKDVEMSSFSTFYSYQNKKKIINQSVAINPTIIIYLIKVHSLKTLFRTLHTARRAENLTFKRNKRSLHLNLQC